jgi:hypothetical protein
MFYLQNFPKLHNGHQLTIESEKGSDSVTFSFVKPIIESD